MEPILPWYIAGPLIGLIVPALLILREKQFGMSSSFSYIIALILPKNEYFKSARTSSNWQFHFGLGVLASAILSHYFISPEDIIVQDLGVHGAYLTKSVYETDNLLAFLVSGILVGFGARYANGCTAGNCIMGVSQFSVSSIIATVAFFVAGVITAQFINPLIF
jgi:uncharacterized membrane protein YedE/YeeE